MFVGKLGRERRRRQRPGWFLDSGGQAQKDMEGVQSKEKSLVGVRGSMLRAGFPGRNARDGHQALGTSRWVVSHPGCSMQ